MIFLIHQHQTWFLLSYIHFKYLEDFSPAQGWPKVPWSRQDWPRRFVWPLRAAAHNWPMCLGESRLKRGLQSATKTSLPPSWRRLAELLSLSSKIETTTAVRLFQAPACFSSFCCDPLWLSEGLHDTRKSGTSDQGRGCTRLHRLHVFSLGWFLQKWSDL